MKGVETTGMDIEEGKGSSEQGGKRGGENGVRGPTWIIQAEKTARGVIP